MRVRFERRWFLQAGLAAAGAAALPLHAADAGVATRELAAGVRLLVGPGGWNSVAVDTAEGLALVDGGEKAHARTLLRQVQAGGRKVALLFNTHWHPHATGCNELLGKAGVRILAQENTRLWLQRPIVDLVDQERHEALPKAAWPTSSFRTRETLGLGGRRFECGQLFQAHTDGDMYVHLPEAKVLVVGGVVGVGRYPLPDSFTGGWIRGLHEATRTLLTLADEGTQVVAERGEVVGRAHLEAQAAMLETLTERLWQLMRKGLSEEDLVAARPTQEFDAVWGDPATFIRQAYRGIWGHVREMRGVV